MAKNILELVIKLTKEGGGETQTVKSLLSIKQGLGQLAVVAGTVTAAVVAVDKVLDATVGKFVSYAGEIRSSSAALSLNAEETSRLKQVLGDFGVELDSVQKALYTARKEGIDVTVEGLADLADQYNAITDPQQKAIFLQEKFGKGGTVLAEVLAQGRDKILEQNASVEAGLILSEQEIQMALDYEIALGDVQDVKEAIAITTGQTLIPLEIEFLQYVNASVKGWQSMLDYIDANDPSKNLEKLSQMRIRVLQEISRYEDSVAQDENPYNVRKLAALREQLAAIDTQITNLKTNNPLEIDIKGNIQDQSAYFNDILSVSKELQTVEEKRAALNDKLAEAVKLYGENSKQAKELRGEIGDLAEETQRWTNQFIFGLMQAQLAADGVLSESDIQKLLVYGEYLGVVSENATESYEEMLLLAGAIEMLPDGKTINIDVNIRQNGSVYVPGAGDVVKLASNKTVQESAYGGMVNDSGFTVVGDIPGLGWGPHAEVIINGQVLPHAQAQFLKDMGLLDGAPAYATGTLTKTGGTFGKRPGNTASGRLPSSNQSTGSITPTTVRSGGGVFGAPAGSESASSVSAVESAAASVAAVDAIAPVVTETVNNFEQSQRLVSRENSAQVARQTAAVVAASAEQTKLLRRIADALDAQAEQLAAEIQKQGGSR